MEIQSRENHPAQFNFEDFNLFADFYKKPIENNPTNDLNQQATSVDLFNAPVSVIKIEKQPANYKPLYSLWPSNNRIFCFGLFMTGPKNDALQNLITWILILAFSITFLVLQCQNEFNWLFLGIIIYLFTGTICFLILTQFSDPGIIPRKQIFEALGKNDSQYIPREDSLNMNEENDVTQKICSVCNIIKRKGVQHCKYCGNCVEMFEQHCPYLNNCIGKRNYKYFVGFIISIILLGIGEITGYLLIFISNFGEDVDNNQIMIRNQTLMIIILCLLGIPTILYTIYILIVIFLQFKDPGENRSLKGIKQYCYRSRSLFQLRAIVESKNSIF